MTILATPTASQALRLTIAMAGEIAEIPHHGILAPAEAAATVASLRRKLGSLTAYADDLERTARLADIARRKNTPRPPSPGDSTP